MGRGAQKNECKLKESLKGSRVTSSKMVLADYETSVVALFSFFAFGHIRLFNAAGARFNMEP